jgi:alpha-tubulin suppressor-like RCC1 family protein
LIPFAGIVPVTGGETHAIAAGIAHTCAITPEGGVQCWGNNDFGQLGDGTNTASNIPVDVVGLEGGTTIVAGGHHTCILSGGNVWCWGQNSQGQLGDGTRTDRNVPVYVLGNAVDITAGLEYTCAVTTFGQVMCWGNNDQGQLADGTKEDRAKPTLAALISGISNVDAGQTRSCGLTSAGLLRCLSNGSAQELGGLPEASLDVAVNRFGSTIVALIEDGIPVTYQSGRFKTIEGVTKAVDVDSGFGHVCSLINNGLVECWGSNYYGQLGRNSRSSSTDPQPVLNVSGAWQLAVGKYHACVLITSNTPGQNDIQCWGLNKDGQLGNGTNESSPVPVFVK